LSSDTNLHFLGDGNEQMPLVISSCLACLVIRSLTWKTVITFFLYQVSGAIVNTCTFSALVEVSLGIFFFF